MDNQWKLVKYKNGKSKLSQKKKYKVFSYDFAQISNILTQRLYNYALAFDHYVASKPGTPEFNLNLQSLLDFFTLDATFQLGKTSQDPSNSNITVTGLDNIRSFMIGLNTGDSKTYYAGWCQHVVTNPIVEIVSDNKEYSILTRAYLTKYFRATDSYKIGTGSYLISWTFKDGSWKIVNYLLDNRMYFKVDSLEKGVVPYIPTK